MRIELSEFLTIPERFSLDVLLFQCISHNLSFDTVCQYCSHKRALHLKCKECKAQIC